ncbi:MAG: bifunctional DNA primase/polymerase [Pseudomonadota bacterium]
MYAFLAPHLARKGWFHQLFLRGLGDSAKGAIEQGWVESARRRRGLDHVWVMTAQLGHRAGGIGYSCGHEDGMVAVDVDRPEDRHELAALADELLGPSPFVRLGHPEKWARLYRVTPEWAGQVYYTQAPVGLNFSIIGHGGHAARAGRVFQDYDLAGAYSGPWP